MSKITSIIIATIIILGTGYIVTSLSTSDTNVARDTNKNIIVENSEVRDGVQYIYITAKGGYFPRSSTAKAGIPTKLVVKTNDTYDCSAALIVRSVNFRKMLPSIGETILEIGTPKPGEYLQGVCGMGMYSFVVAFN